MTYVGPDTVTVMLCTAGPTGILLHAAAKVGRLGLTGADTILSTLLATTAVAEQACAPLACALRAANVAVLSHSCTAATRAFTRAHCWLNSDPCWQSARLCMASIASTLSLHCASAFNKPRQGSMHGTVHWIT